MVDALCIMNAERQRQHEDKKMETLFTGRVYDHYGETVQEYTGINADALEQKYLRTTLATMTFQAMPSSSTTFRFRK